MPDNTLRFLLVDDDEFFLSTLSSMIEDLDYIVSHTCLTYRSASQAINKGDFDLAVLDISLSSGTQNEEGIALGMLLQKQRLPFIYITGLQDKAIVKRAAITHPAAYLSKPLTELQLFSAIQLAFQHHQQGVSAQVESTEPAFFFVRVGQGVQRVDWESVYGLRATPNYVEVLCQDRSVAVPVRGTLKTFLESKFPVAYQESFVRINRSELLHKKVIQFVNNKEVITPYGTFSTTRSKFLRSALPSDRTTK